MTARSHNKKLVNKSDWILTNSIQKAIYLGGWAYAILILVSFVIILLIK